jgi:hypothetical protein
MRGRKTTPAPGTKRATEPTEPPDPADQAFDVWLHRGLHKLYDDVAAQPLPDDLLRMIEADRRARGK